jgi:putative ABC transport system substrate-binding protein
MRRREFVRLLGGSAVAWPLGARAQQTSSGPNMPKIGILWGETPSMGGALIEALAGLGYIDGKTVQIIQEFSKTEPEELRERAQKLVDQKVDVIVAVPAMGANAAKKITNAVPIVVVLASDLLGMGLVESLAHPGGNVTGPTLMSEDLNEKRLSLLKEAVPTLVRITFLFDPATLFPQRYIDAQLKAAKALGIPLRPVSTATPDAIDRAFADLPSDSTEAVTFSASPMMTKESIRIGAAALAHRIPTVGYHPGMARNGLLMAYGQDFSDYYKKAAVYVDKILKGAKPADLPIEQPTQLKLAINLKTAKALGLTIPASLIVAADEVIE